MVANILAAKNFDFAADHRASILRMPQLLSAHHATHALRNWLNGKFLDAGQQFWAVLRRQIALGSAEDSRVTKAQYARCILEELAEASESERRTGLFWLGLRLLIESGQVDDAKRLHWNDEILRSHIDQELLKEVIEHATRHEGSRIERTSVVIECFASWVPLLAREQSQLAHQMLRYLIQIATERKQTSWTTANVGARSIKLLTELAVKRPEFIREVAKEIAHVVTIKLQPENDWNSQKDAMELANAYVGRFANEDLVDVFDGVLALLDRIDPTKDQWPIVNPAMELMMSDETPRLSAVDPERGARIIATILRFGLNQQSEHARLLFFLQDFDFSSLRDESVAEKLQEIVQYVSTRAEHINSSNAIYNVNALLYSSKLSGPAGVKIALGALKHILQSPEAGRSNISFATAYQSLDLLARRHDIIVEDTSMESTGLQSVLMEIYELVVRVWALAKDQPLIFSVFSIPPATRPNPTLVQNWAYASISFAGLLDRRPDMLTVLATAETEQALKEPIALARATRILVGDPEELTADGIRDETAPAFYASLGQRLLQLSALADQQRLLIVEAMLKKCLRVGPQGLDAAVFLAAADCGIKTSADDHEHENYRVRLDNQPNLRLSLFPMLNRLEK
jgi:hypothetical protein